MKHTPGKWTVKAYGIYCDDAKGSIVARVWGQGFEYVPRPDEECKANARLIAAAPELLEVLGSLAREATGFVEMAAFAAHGHTNIAVMRQKIDDAFAAIAKAEGLESPSNQEKQS